MLYQAFQAQSDFMQPIRLAADATARLLRSEWLPMADTAMVRHAAAGAEMLSRAAITHERPPYGIDEVTVGNQRVAVTEEAAGKTPFCTLLHFRKDIDVAQPRVLVVAPLSGHFATLLRGTVETLLQDHDVYITDWHNMRDVPLEAGRFGFDDYVSHVIKFLEDLGPGAHIVAVCQPCVQALTAVALMSEDNNPATPASMTLMAGPVDCRVSPTSVNELATDNPIEWFADNLIYRVPQGFAGAGRRVYPGFLQLSAFMNMNPERHTNQHIDLFGHLSRGDMEEAEQIKTFYDEYFAVLDMSAEFYLETVQWVFQEYRLAKGELSYRGHRVDPGAIRRTSLLTVEGERDDICSVGQTVAAHDLCTRLRPSRKKHHLQAGVGHYGVFNGRKWRAQIYPLVRNVILSSD